MGVAFSVTKTHKKTRWEAIFQLNWSGDIILKWVLDVKYFQFDDIISEWFVEAKKI